MQALGISGYNVSFASNSSIIISHDQRNIDKLKKINDKLFEIVKAIGGINSQSTFEANVIKAKEKIMLLRKETIEAWKAVPSALKPKLAKLDGYNDELTALNNAYKKVNKDIDEDSPGLVGLDGKKINPKDKEKGDKVVTDTLDIMAIYNNLPKSTSDIKRRLAEQASAQKKTQAGHLSIAELKNSLSELNKDNWDFAKLNAADAKLYPKLKNILMIDSIKDTIQEQIKLIDLKLEDLKTNGGKPVPSLGVTLYTPEVTGKIMALETARLRRTTLEEQIIMPGVIENLDKPDVMLKTIPNGSYDSIKIDRSFVPKPLEIKEMLKLNKPYGPIIKELYPDGLKIHLIPGYYDHDGGDYEGGDIVLNGKDTAVWLNSYNNDERYAFTAMSEKHLATLREIRLTNHSVLKGNKDRARVLAHELGHAVCYKKMIDEMPAEDKKPSEGIIFELSNDLSFYKAWQGLRMGTPLNNKSTHHSQTRFLTDEQLANLTDAIHFEMIAEDIRMAITGDELPASSKLTGFVDQTEAGKDQYNKVITFIKQCLLENKNPAEALFNDLQMVS